MRRLFLAVLAVAALSAASCGVGSKPWGDEDSRVIRSYKLTRSGSGGVGLCDTSLGCPKIGLWFGNAIGATLTPEIGSYTLTVGGNPTRVRGPTYPEGLASSPGYALLNDGTGDFLSLAQGAGGEDFAEPIFSVFMCLVPTRGIVANDHWSSNAGGAANQRSWYTYTANTSDFAMLISDDGTTVAGHVSTVQKNAVIGLNMLHCVTYTYEFKTSGTSEGNIYVDEFSVASNNSMVGPPYVSGNSLLSIAGSATTAPNSLWVAYGYWAGELTQADHLRLSRGVRGLRSSSGAGNPMGITSATSPSVQVDTCALSGVFPCFIDVPANTGLLGRTAYCVGLYAATAITNKCWRGSMETWAGGVPTGWTESVTSTGDCDAVYPGVHGSFAARCVLADADDAVTLTSGCATVTGGTAMRLSAWAGGTSGTPLLDVKVIEDDSADCSSPTTTTAVINHVAPGSAWGKQEGSITLQAGTIRAQVQVVLPAAAAQITYVDAVQFRAGTVSESGLCVSDADADAVCSTVLNSHASAISANGAQTVEGTFCTPYAGADLSASTYLWNDGTTGANVWMARIYSTTDELSVRLYDGAATYTENVPNSDNWAANTPYKIRFTMDGKGRIAQTWPSGTWFDTQGGAGTGIRTGSNSSTFVGSSSSAGGGVWSTEVTYSRGENK